MENENINNNQNDPDAKENLKKDKGTGLYDLGVAIGGKAGGVIGKDNPNVEGYDHTLMQEKISIKPEGEKDKD